MMSSRTPFLIRAFSISSVRVILVFFIKQLVFVRNWFMHKEGEQITGEFPLFSVYANKAMKDLRKFRKGHDTTPSQYVR